MTVDRGPSDALAPQPFPAIAGFDIVEVTQRDDLGFRCRARERSTGLVRAVRVVGVPLTLEQRQALRRLWGGLLRRSLDPSLTTIVDYGVTADGAPWVATDDGSGESLASQLAARRPPTPQEVERMAAAIAGALQVLHSLGHVHGGISPAVIVSDRGSWRLADVAITPVVWQFRPGHGPAAVGEVTSHCAPEYLAGESPTAAADVYALGATVWEVLVGRPLVPWQPGDTAAALLERSAGRSPRSSEVIESQTLRALVEAAWDPDPDRRSSAAVLHERLGSLSAAPAGAPERPANVTDDDVRFTVYRPHSVRPERWYTLLAFAHKTDPSDPDFGPADPLKEVRRQANSVLGDDLENFVTAVEDSASVIERGTELTFVPQMEGVEFNPPDSSFHWVEAVHREEFRFRASRALDGRRARGRLSVFLGNLLVADVNLTLRVDSNPVDAPTPELEPVSTRPYRKIFASYSHRDDAIVSHIGTLVRSLGDEFVRDTSHLRAGEVWSEQLEELIREADVFQLFWSTNSLASPFVRQEWEFALSLDRPSFVRPCYWETPLPARPAENLPPEALRRLHFQLLGFSPPKQAANALPAPPPPPPLAPTGTGTGSYGSPAPPSPPKPRRRWAAGVAGVGAAAAALVLALGLQVGGGDAPDMTAAPPSPQATFAPSAAPGRNFAPTRSRPPPPSALDPSTVAVPRLDDIPLELPEDGGVYLEEQAQRCEEGSRAGCQALLDELTEICADGSGLACDALWAVSPIGSAYQRYGATCGERVEGTSAGRCRDR